MVAANGGGVSSEPQHPRGRHARPPSKAAVLGERVVETVLSESHRRKVVLAGGGVVCAAVLAVTAVVALPGGDRQGRATSAASTDRPAGTAAGLDGAVDPSPAGGTVTTADADPQAIAYFRQ